MSLSLVPPKEILKELLRRGALRVYVTKLVSDDVHSLYFVIQVNENVLKAPMALPPQSIKAIK